MLNAALVAILAAAPIAGSAQPLPPITIRVAIAPGITPSLIAGVLAETDAVWKGTGVSFLWRRDDRPVDRAQRSPLSEPPYGALLVSIGYETHRVEQTHLPLGWIVFDDPTTPHQEISLSYANAVTLLERSPGVVGAAATMPRLQRELLLARAMGRALAHELGHYLSASKAHAKAGLMRAVQTSFELFSNERAHFTMAAADRQRIVARMTSIYMASRG
jgi:hypothetical protein